MRRIFASVLAALLILVLAVPAVAAPAPPAHVEERVSPYGQSRAGSPGRPSSDPDEPVVVVGEPGETLVTDADTVPVAPGLTLTSFDRLDARGWLRGDVLTAELDTAGLSTDLLFPGSVAAPDELSDQAERQGAVAGVNGDFFDIGDTGAPLGGSLTGGQLLSGPTPGRGDVVGVGGDGIGRLVQLLLEGTVSLPAGDTPLAGLNQPVLARGGVGAYTPIWGAASRAGAVEGAVDVAEAVVVDGVVSEVRDAAGAGPIAEDTIVLLGREDGAAALRALQPGDPVTIAYGPRTDPAADLRFAVGGGPQLIRDGEVLRLDDTVAAPRTAVGLSADGRTMHLVVVDGRQGDSRGMTLHELAELLATIGADDALNLDGGGSSTLVARPPGAARSEVANQPSDGGERPVPNGIGLFAAAGSGRLTGLWLEPVGQTPEEVGEPARVFPGLTRTFVARGHDETYAPVDAAPYWRTQPGGLGRFDEPGVLRGGSPGRGEVLAFDRRVIGRAEVVVLGPLARIDTDPGQVSIPGGGASARFAVTGFDAEGFDAPVEARDVALDYDRSVVTIEPTEGGDFLVTPLVESGAVAVRIRVGDVETVLPVTVGLSTVPVEDYDDGLDGWGVTQFPAAVGASIEPAPGRDGGGALALDYDFSATTATRAAYVQASPRVELPGQPQRIGMWVNGDGNGAWLRMVVTDAAGVNTTLSLTGQEPGIDFTGWRYLETAVPAGVQYPLRLWRVYPVETDPAEQYQGRLLIDDIVARVPQSLDVPAVPGVADPVVVTDGRLGDDRWRFAVMSDAQFVAASGPDGALADQARRTLREIVGADPDFVVVNGDLVDTAYPEDFDLARQILDEEVPDDLPLYYSPGNHEVAGPGTIDNFVAEFGETRRTFDHKGTRFVLLNSSTGSFRSAEYDQLLDLRASLDDAVDDPSIEHVVVMAHHPPRDPSPAANSQLSDRKEAALVEQWLADFETDSGKDAAYIGSHAGVFHAERVDGVPYVLTGNSGKSPSAAPDDGGFTGWGLFGVSQAVTRPPGRPGPPDRPGRPSRPTRGRGLPDTGTANGEWLAAELRPHVDALTLDAPRTLAVGETVEAGATVRQDGREVPVAYPVSADWSGGPNLHIGPVGEARGRHTAAFDPATGEFVGLRDGRVVLAVTVNGETATATVDVAAALRPAA